MYFQIHALQSTVSIKFYSKKTKPKRLQSISDMPNFNDNQYCTFYRFDDPSVIEDVEFTNANLMLQKWQQQYGSDPQIKYAVDYHLKTDTLRFLLPRFQHKDEYVIDEHGIIVGYWESDTLYHYGRISKEMEIQVLASSKRLIRQPLGKFQNWVF